MRSKLNNESGVVLVTVLAVSIVLMIFTIGILSSNINQIALGHQTINRIKAEEFGKGYYWIQHMRLSNGQSQVYPVTSGVTLDGKTFTQSTTPVGVQTGINQTQRYDISVDY